MTALGKFSLGLRTFIGDVANGMMEITHSGLAMLGLLLVLGLGLAGARDDLRTQGETHLRAWLLERHEVTQAALRRDDIAPPEPLAIERATAANPKDLPKQQATVAYWLSKKYSVAPEPIAALVAEAYDIGAKAKIEPTLILAVMAIESSFNPFAQSPVGAQGLMQVMTTVHNEKYDSFGGKFAAFDPVSNLRVGVKVLQDCINRNGGVELGLRCYVGATTNASEGGYAAKVMAEHARLRVVAGGKALPIDAPMAAPPPVATPAKPKAAPVAPTAVELAKEDPDKLAVL
jgi:Transglycosylase SLT domain